VDECIRLGLPALWLQEGVVDEAAADRAGRRASFVVMDRCIMKDRAGSSARVSIAMKSITNRHVAMIAPETIPRTGRNRCSFSGGEWSTMLEMVAVPHHDASQWQQVKDKRQLWLFCKERTRLGPEDAVAGHAPPSRSRLRTGLRETTYALTRTRSSRRLVERDAHQPVSFSSE